MKMNRRESKRIALKCSQGKVVGSSNGGERVESQKRRLEEKEKEVLN